ncbi:MAG: BglG family transcription antiterminator [Erysipelotrichaceae bacterium]
MQFNKRQIEIYELLLHKNTIVTSTELSKVLLLSEKTIRNEIKNMNQFDQNPVILTKKGQGFLINKDNLLDLKNHDCSFDSMSRQILILKKLLSVDEISYYDLTDEFYISTSTLDKDIITLNNVIKRRNTNAQITRVNNQVFIAKDEVTRRQIYTYFLMQEIENYDFDISNYTDYFPRIDLNELKLLVINFNKEKELHLKDFEIISLILHVAIMIERISKGNKVPQSITISDDFINSNLALQFSNELMKIVDVSLNEAEHQYLTSLFSNNLHVYPNKTMIDYNNFVSKIIQDIKVLYEIDLSNDEVFKQSLLIHLVNLDSRIQTQQYLNNPLIGDIKKHFPLIYDLSVYIADAIQQLLNIQLIEDEIGYLSLHLMCAVDKLRKLAHKTIIIINPLGRASTTYIKNKLLQLSDFCIDVIDTYSMFDLKQVTSYDASLIVSTLPIKEKVQIPIYECNMMLNDTDLIQIHNLLNQSNYKKTKCFFYNSLFFPKETFSNKEEIIHFLCEKLQAQGFCDELYETSVLKREVMAPTAYGNQYAIPHPIHKIAKKTGVAVMTLKHSILWNGHKTKLILLFSLSNHESTEFSIFYEQVVNCLNNPEIIKRLIKETNYSNFIKYFDN